MNETVLKKIIAYGPLLPCLAVAVLVLSGLSGYHAPSAALSGSTGQSASTQAASSETSSAGSSAGASGNTTTSGATIARATTATTRSRNSGTAAAATANTAAAAGAQKSLGTVQEAAAYKDGTYTGTATGFRGPVSVKVTISGGKITAIDITASSDDNPYFSNAKGVISKIINGQTTNVDVVSGATYSSNGIIGAVRNALSKAAVSSSAQAEVAAGTTTLPTTTTSPTTRAPVTAGQAGQFPYPDGTYEGVGEGRNDIIRVAVTIQNGSLIAIQVLEHYEDEDPYFKNARTLLDDILTSQSTGVDTVSGATLSSNGLIEAVNNALNNAKNGTTATDQSTSSTTTTSGTATTGTSPTSTTDATSSAQPANTGTYKDGDYYVSVTCYPDADEDFEAYTLTMKVTIQNDKITSISSISGNGASSNDSYISRAANGKSSSAGVVSQITSSGGTSGIDAVSGATCTSDAIVSGANQALAQAAAANK